VTIADNPTGDTAPGDVKILNPTSGPFFVDAGGITSGRINVVNYRGQTSSDDLFLFFDLVAGANAAQLITDLNAAAGGAFVASASTFGGADLVLQFDGQGQAGADKFIDFNFGTVGVARVGVPEPSTMTLAAMSLIGLVGYGVRRRRSA
jgi:hypothetical protein